MYVSPEDSWLWYAKEEAKANVSNGENELSTPFIHLFTAPSLPTVSLVFSSAKTVISAGEIAE